MKTVGSLAAVDLRKRIRIGTIEGTLKDVEHHRDDGTKVGDHTTLILDGVEGEHFPVRVSYVTGKEYAEVVDEPPLQTEALW